MPIPGRLSEGSVNLDGALLGSVEKPRRSDTRAQG
jgi:hypothetical protein